MLRLLAITLTCLWSANLFAQPLFWSAQKGDLHYLILGSVHVGDESMYPLPTAITHFLAKSDGLIIETDVRKTDGAVYPPATLLTKQVTSEQEASQIARIAKETGLSYEVLMQLPPWQTALSVQMAQFSHLGYNPGDGVDMRLMSKATINNVPVLSLEPLQFQIDMLTRQPQGGKELLTSILNDYDKGEQLTDCLINSWKAGDAQKLVESADLSSVSDTFTEQFLYQRNRDWATKLDNGTILPKPAGRYLVVVGALHLVGKDNLIDLLTQKGFQIAQLSDSQIAHCML